MAAAHLQNPLRRRPRISATLAPESLAFLQEIVNRGDADNISDALDLILQRARQGENRRRLATAIAAYHQGLSPSAEEEEQEIASRLSRAGSRVTLDDEP